MLKPARRRTRKWARCSCSTSASANARKFGVDLIGDAVLDAQHTFVLILEAEDKAYIEQFMQPFAMAGSVEIVPASSCETVVERQGCEPVAAAD
jgi:uncharacterized protein with GYD domain